MTAQTIGGDPVVDVQAFSNKEGTPLQALTTPAIQEQAKQEITHISSLVMGTMPNFSEKQIENWKKHTGLSPQEHRAKGDALLSSFATRINGFQQALLDHQTNIISYAETKTSSFQTSIVNAGIQRSNQTFSTIKTTLNQSAQAANTTIQNHQTTGEGLLKTAQAEQNRQMKESFQKAREALTNEETIQTTPFSAEKDKFVQDLDALASSERTISIAKGDEYHIYKPLPRRIWFNYRSSESQYNLVLLEIYTPGRKPRDVIQWPGLEIVSVCFQNLGSYGSQTNRNP